MKKLLSLLPIVTITGSSMITVIAVNSFEHLEIIEKKNNIEYNINYENVKESTSFVEKIYDYNKSIWNLSIVLSKEKLLEIIKLFVQNNQNDFIAKTKQVIMEIKKHSINFSAEAFDENAIDAYAHIFRKNFSHYYICFYI